MFMGTIFPSVRTCRAAESCIEQVDGSDPSSIQQFEVEFFYRRAEARFLFEQVPKASRSRLVHSNAGALLGFSQFLLEGCEEGAVLRRLRHGLGLRRGIRDLTRRIPS
jgi:hypothetical protein